MVNKLKNKLLLFPKPILREVNKLIDQGFGPANIKKLIKDRYTGKLKVPSKPTIQRYIVWYKKNTDMSSKSLTEVVQGDLQDTNNEATDAENLTVMSRKQILENLINRCNDRLNKLEELDIVESSAALEHCIVGYVTEIRRNIETLLKLSGELKDDDKVVVNIVEGELGKFFKAVAETVKEVYGSKGINIFKEKLKKRLKGKL